MSDYAESDGVFKVILSLSQDLNSDKAGNAGLCPA